MRRRSLSLLLVLSLAAALVAGRPSVATAAPSPSVVATAQVGALEPISITILDGPGNRADWFGLYAVGAPSSAYLDWSYLAGGRTYPPVPIQPVTGAITFLRAPATPGSYEIRFYADNGYGLLATSNPITVTASPPVLTLSARTVAPGGTVAVTFGGGLPQRLDWLGVVPAASDFGEYLDWKYLNDSTVPPSAALTSGTVTLTLPTIPGRYKVTWFGNDTTGVLTSSEVISVVAGAGAAISSNAQSPSNDFTSVGPGARVIVSFNGTGGSTTDWIGLYAVGAPSTSFLAWTYLNGTTAAPSTPLSSGQVTFTMPTAPGQYEFRLLANDGYQELTTTRAPANVRDPVVQVGTSNPAPGSRVNVIVRNAAGYTTDWIGVYPVGAPDRAYFSWVYLNGTQIPPLDPLFVSLLSSALPVPTQPGQYEVRLYRADGFTRDGTSSVFTVR